MKTFSNSVFLPGSRKHRENLKCVCVYFNVLESWWSNLDLKGKIISKKQNHLERYDSILQLFLFICFSPIWVWSISLTCTQSETRCSRFWRTTCIRESHGDRMTRKGEIRPAFNPWVGKIPWRSKWQPTPVFLPELSHGWRSLAGYSPWGCKESDTTEQLTHNIHNIEHLWIRIKV